MYFKLKKKKKVTNKYLPQIPLNALFKTESSQINFPF